jgi:PIN domain nuclease of toxin-antitoxin system
MQKLPDIKLILDTHVFLWLMDGSPELSQQAKDLIIKTTEESSIAISAISLWEISMLQSRKRILLNTPCLQWLNRSLEAPGMALYHLSPEVAVESAVLPGAFHGDPADRIIVASARILGVPLVTRDQEIIAYGNKSYLNCIKA